MLSSIVRHIGNCHTRHQPLFHGTEHNVKTFLSNGNQAGIVYLSWEIWNVDLIFLSWCFALILICTDHDFVLPTRVLLFVHSEGGGPI